MIIRDNDRMFNTDNVVTMNRSGKDISITTVLQTHYIEFCDNAYCEQVYNRLAMALCRGENFFNVRTPFS